MFKISNGLSQLDGSLLRSCHIGWVNRLANLSAWQATYWTYTDCQDPSRQKPQNWPSPPATSHKIYHPAFGYYPVHHHASDSPRRRQHTSLWQLELASLSSSLFGSLPRLPQELTHRRLYTYHLIQEHDSRRHLEKIFVATPSSSNTRLVAIPYSRRTSSAV